jgi:hypothetical protein
MRIRSSLFVTLLSLQAIAQDVSASPPQSPDTNQNPSAVAVQATTPSSSLSPTTKQAAATPLSTKGIIVAPPKIYDNYYLQQLLSSLRSRLETLQVVDKTTLLSHIGQTQGATLQQLGFSLQGAGPSTPTVSSFALAPGVTPFSSTGSPTATTPGTTTATTPLAPSNPAPSPAALTLPTIGQSSLDTLNESMQLAYEITNVELLLNGATSDQIQADTGLPRSTFTVGFPITVLPPEKDDKQLADSLVEIQVTICESRDASIVTLLPRERTYNVASLLDNSLAASIGTVLGGVFSIGGGFLWHHQTYYLVQQQETVALQYSSGACGSGRSSTSFAWQIHPVLGKNYVRPGMETNFVQVSIPDPLAQPGGTLVQACVRAGWRKTKDKGNRLQPISNDTQKCFDIKYYSTTPTVQSVKVSDVGSGNVLVQSTGTFLDGTRIRIAGKNPPSTAYISSDQRNLAFYASASDIVSSGGVTIVSREGDEQALLVPLPSRTPQSPTPSKVSITSVSVLPYSDSQSLVTIDFSTPSGPLPSEPCAPVPGAVNPPPCIPSDPWVVNIGDKLFGLADSPFFVSSTNEIKLLAPTSSVAGAPKIQMRRLLWPDQFYYDERPLDKSAIVVTKASLLAPAPELSLAFAGINLDQARLQYPECGDCLKAVTSTFATVSFSAKKNIPGLDADSIKALRQIVMCRKDKSYPAKCDAAYAPVMAEIPKDDSGAAKDSKPKLDKHEPIKPGTGQVSITGTGLDQIVAIKAGPTVMQFHLSIADKPALIVSIPPAVSNVEGQYPLFIELSDKTTTSYLLAISSKAKN